MSDFGKFNPLVFVNDSTVPPISAANLNDIENNISAIDTYLGNDDNIRFDIMKDTMYKQNCKTIDLFQYSTDWTAAGATLSNDTVNWLHGFRSVKMLEPDNVASWVGMYRSVSPALDLSTFDGGDSSVDNDYIVFSFYLSNVNDWTYIQWKLGTDNANNYSITIAPPTGLRTGFNSVAFAKSAFTENGTPPAWSNITYIRIEGYSKANKINTYISCQYMGLVKDNNSEPNPFSYDGDILFTAYKGMYTILQDLITSELSIVRLDPYLDSTSEYDLYLGSGVNFIASFEGHQKEEYNSPNITLFIDTNNYVTAWLDTNIIQVKYVVAGVPTTVTFPSTAVVTPNDNSKFELGIKRVNNIFNFYIKNICAYSNYSLSIPDFENEIMFLYIGHNLSADFARFCFTNAMLCNSIFKTNLKPEFPILVKKTENQAFNNTTTFANVDDMVISLPVGLYEVDFWLVGYNATSATPDLKVYWELTNISQVTGKRFYTLPSNTTNVEDSNIKSTLYNLNTSLTIGLEGAANETILHENFLIKVEKSGGKIQLRAAQATANVSDSIITSSTTMKISKMNYSLGV